MHSETIKYSSAGKNLVGKITYDDSTTNKRPAILIFHDWTGRNAFADNKAEQLAQLGYVGFAADMYGDGQLGTTTEEKSQLIQPFMQDRHLVSAHAIAALEAVKQHACVDDKRIAAIGYCFGGLCALDLARAQQPIRGAVSFHGLLTAPTEAPPKPIQTKILALHGYADPMVPPEQVLAFAKEMTAAKADWQLHAYGNTLHAFTNPEANDSELGTIYNATAEKRSWQSMRNFLTEIFA